MKTLASRILLTALAAIFTSSNSCIAQSESPAAIANEQPSQTTADDTSTKETTGEGSKSTEQAQPDANAILPQTSGFGGGYGGMSGGFGGGGGGFAGSGGYGGGLNTSERLVSSVQVMIGWSAEKDELRGFSNSLGEWAILKVPVQPQIVPVAGGDVAAVRLQNAMAAYSGANGRWDLVTLPKESKAVPVLHEHVAQFQDGEHLYTFAAAKGMWTSPTDDDLQVGEFSCEFDQAVNPNLDARFNQWLDDPENPHRTHLVIYSNPFNPYQYWNVQYSRLTAMKAAQAHLDSLKSADIVLAQGAGHQNRSPAPITQPTHGNSSNSNVDDLDNWSPSPLSRSLADVENEIAETAAVLLAVEAECQAVAAAVREQNSDEVDITELNLLVTTAFDVRHKLQTAESEKLEIKLAAIKQNLTGRNSNRARIVERRIEELLDPNGTATSWLGSATKSSFMIGKTKDGNDAALSMQQAEWPAKHGFEATAESNNANSPTGLAAPPLMTLAEFLKRQTDTPYVLSRPNSNQYITLPSPSEAAQKLRSARSILNSKNDEIRKHEAFILRMGEGLRHSQNNAHPLDYRKQEIATLEKMLEIRRKQSKKAESEWRAEWNNYQSYLKLLQLDVDQNQQNVESAKRLFSDFQCDKDGRPTSSPAHQSEQELHSFENQLQRSQAIFELYNNIATTEPELNPDYQPAAAE